MNFHSVLSISRSITSSTMSTFRIALIQLKVTPDKVKNVENAVNFVCAAKKNSADIVVLPEIFNSPYGTKYFPLYAEEVPNGDTCKRLSQCAKENKIFIVGGSIPEKEGNRLYNTCTVWNPLGQLVAKHRKIHLFDIDIPGRMTFKESDALTAGQDITTFQVDKLKVGIGICYDIRFPELANIYRKEGCNLIIYPGAFNMTTGPLHWKLLARARACDNQVYVAAVSPASDAELEYVAYGHTMLVNPMGEVEIEAAEGETILYKDIDLKKITETRDQIPILKQRRTDIYDVVYNGK